MEASRDFNLPQIFIGSRFKLTLSISATIRLFQPTAVAVKGIIFPHVILLCNVQISS